MTWKSVLFVISLVFAAPTAFAQATSRTSADATTDADKPGPAMLPMATGTETRHGFALILHRKNSPPTTLVHDWMPKGLCHP